MESDKRFALVEGDLVPEGWALIVVTISLHLASE